MQQASYGATAQGHTNTGNPASIFPQRRSRWQDHATHPLQHWEATAHHLHVTGIIQLLSWKNGLRTVKDLLQERAGGTALIQPCWHSQSLAHKVVEKRQFSAFLHAKKNTPVLISPVETHIQRDNRPLLRTIIQNPCCFSLLFLMLRK